VSKNLSHAGGSPGASGQGQHRPGTSDRVCAKAAEIQRHD